MSFLIEIVVFLFLLLPGILAVLYHLILGVIGLCLENRPKKAAKRKTRIAILVPAHDEELMIAATLRRLLELDYSKELYTVFVIADNCSDRTAAIAKEAGAGVQVLERFNTEKRGKGFALAWAIPKILGSGAWDGILIVDADCLLDSHALDSLDFYAQETPDTPLQLNYVVGNGDASPQSFLLAVANRAENDLFYAPKEALGLFVILRGTGMFLPRAVLEEHPWNAYSVTEDTEYALTLLQDGIPTRFVAEARVVSDFPEDRKTLSVQRKRWAGGMLERITHHAFPLMSAGLSQKSLRLFDAGWTFLVLSKPVLFLQWALTVGCCGFLFWPLRTYRGSSFLILSLLLGGGYLLYFLMSMYRFGMTRERWGLALRLPIEAGHYLGLTVRSLIAPSPQTWDRSPRTTQAARASESVPPKKSGSLRIAHLTASPFFGGPERQMLELARAFREKTPDVEFLFLSFAENGNARPFLEEAEKAGFRTTMLQNDMPHLLAAAKELTRILQENDVDLVLLHGHKARMVCWLSRGKNRIPVIGVSRGWTSENWKIALYNRLDQWLLRRMNHVVCVSQGQANKVLESGVPKERVSVIRNAIRTERFDRTPDPDDHGKLEAMFPKPPQYLIADAGRFSPEKGFDILLSALARLRRENLSVGLVLFGDGFLRESLERQAEALGISDSVVFPGFTKELDRWMPHFDLFVQSSLSEGLPNVLLEAMGARTAVVATTVGGTAEVVQHGVTGLLVPSNRPKRLAAAVRELLEDEPRRHKMGEAGRRRVEEHFTFEAQVKDYRELFSRFISKTKER